MPMVQFVVVLVYPVSLLPLVLCSTSWQHMPHMLTQIGAFVYPTTTKQERKKKKKRKKHTLLIR